MGLFSRKKDAEGLYIGDAPVSAPGLDGEAPGAYIRPDDAGSGYPGTASTWADTAVPYPSETASPGVASYPSGPQPIGAPPTVPGMTPPPPGPTSPAAPGAGGLDAASVAGLRQVIGQRRSAPVAAGDLDPETAARVQQALAGMSGRGRRLGCVLLAVPLLGAAVGIGAAIYAAVHATSAVDGAISAIQPGGSGAPGGRHLGVTTLGEPVSIRTSDAAYDITVFGAETQAGGGWGYDSAGGSAVLVVDAQITRTDTGADPVEFTGWNWSVVDTGGDRVTGNIISHFLPSLDGPELVGGQTARGYVTFDTAVTTTSLTVAGGPAGAGLATWQLTASTPRPVHGAVGEPARAELSRPGFTVTIDVAEVVAKDDPRIGYRPNSGQYLVLPVEFAGVDGTQGHLGTVDSDRFVLVPDAAPALQPTFGGVDDAFSFVSLDAAAPEKGSLAFDTTATTGRLELRDQADRAIITWRID